MGCCCFVVLVQINKIVSRTACYIDAALFARLQVCQCRCVCTTRPIFNLCETDLSCPMVFMHDAFLCRCELSARLCLMHLAFHCMLHQRHMVHVTLRNMCALNESISVNRGGTGLQGQGYSTSGTSSGRPGTNRRPPSRPIDILEDPQPPKWKLWEM